MIRVLVRALLRTHAAPWLATLVAAAFAVPLTGCATADPDLGAVQRQNLALHRGSDDGRTPIAGGWGPRAVAAARRYESGTVAQPAAAATGGAQ